MPGPKLFGVIPLAQISLYGLIPPLIVKLTDALLSPKHKRGFIFSVIFNESGSSIDIEIVSVHCCQF